MLIIRTDNTTAELITQTLVLLVHSETDSSSILGTLFPEGGPPKLYLNSMTITGGHQCFDEPSQLRWTVAQEKPKMVRYFPVVATALPNKS